MMAPQRSFDLNTPFHKDTLLQVRTSKMKTMKNLNLKTGIYKEPRSGRVYVSSTGLTEDEHDLTFHGGVDKAIHQYSPHHYPRWREEFPEAAENFIVGSFGENFTSNVMNERNVCIGDVVRVGPEVILQVSLPRQPCFKLNHRFGLKSFAPNTWKKSRTGWYYRVLKEGWVQAGDEMELLERNHHKWTIERVQEYLHRDTKNLAMLEQLVKIEEFGDECKKAFTKLIGKARAEEEARSNGRKKKAPEVWREFEVVDKWMESLNVCSFTLQSIDKTADAKLDPGSFARLKLPNGLVRSYSIVSGTTNCFQLGIGLVKPGRGGSSYMHNNLHQGDKLLVGDIKQSVPIVSQASNHIFIAGGIGITAFLSHIQKYEAINFNHILHYAVRSDEHFPFRSQLDAMGNKLIIYDKSKGQRMDIEAILRNRTWNSKVYLCGPTRMIEEAIRASKACGMSADEIHYEAFSLDTSGDPFVVKLKQSGKKLQVGEEETLLEVLREAGLDVDSSCEAGNCGTCRVEVCEGKVDHRGSGLGEDDKRVAMLSCVSRGVGRIVVDL